jgi:general secretion pathway protein D
MVGKCLNLLLVCVIGVQPSLSAGAQLPNRLPPAAERAVQRQVQKAPEQEIGNIEFNFENADLQNLLDYMAGLYHIAFMPDDAVKPMLQSGKAVAGNKINFRTERPMTKKEVWTRFTQFLSLTGLTLTKTPNKGVYRITSFQAANKMALPSYIGTDSNNLPDDDSQIRYVYFLKNTTIDNIKPVIEQLRSVTSAFTAFVPLRAIILTDKSYNIKALMRIVKELDKASPPEVMTIIKLKHTGAEDFKKLYDELTKGDDQRGMVAKIFGARKQNDGFFFPETTRVISEPRTNSLIVFGNQETVKKIEDFVAKVDREVTEVASPLYIYELQHTDATAVADLMNKVTQFGVGTAAAQAGGVREGEKYFKPITFTPEKSGNRLVIRGDYEDYLKAREIISQLDVMQPQVAMEVLIVTADLNRAKMLGSQIRNKTPNMLSHGVSYQTSGFNSNNTVPSNVVVNNPPGSGLMSSLIGLATGASQGTTLMTLQAANGVWSIFEALQNYVNLNVVANPFLVTSNKFEATVQLGTILRTQTSTVISGGNNLQGFGDLNAYIQVTVTPQINTDGLIQLQVKVTDDEFQLNNSGALTPNRTTRSVNTSAIVADKEILVIGGLIKNTTNARVSGKVPILGDIPIIGWLFKNRTDNALRQNLMVFISPQIVQPKLGGGINAYTSKKADYARKTLQLTEKDVDKHDPVYRWFFKGNQPESTRDLDDFIARKMSSENAQEIPELAVLKSHEEKRVVDQLQNQKKPELPQNKISQQLPKVGTPKERVAESPSVEKVATAPKNRSGDHKLFQDTAFFNFDESNGTEHQQPAQHYRTDGTRGPIEPVVTAQAPAQRHSASQPHASHHVAAHQPRRSFSSFFDGGHG